MSGENEYEELERHAEELAMDYFGKKWPANAENMKTALPGLGPMLQSWYEAGLEAIYKQNIKNMLVLCSTEMDRLLKLFNTEGFTINHYASLISGDLTGIVKVFTKSIGMDDYLPAGMELKDKFFRRISLDPMIVSRIKGDKVDCNSPKLQKYVEEIFGAEQ